MKLTSILSEIVTGRNRGINFTKYLGTPQPGEDLYDFIEKHRFYNSIINSTSPQGMGDVDYEIYITLRVPEEEALKYNEIPVDVRSDSFFRFLRKYYGDRIIEVESMPASLSNTSGNYSVPFFVKVRGVVDPEEGTRLPYRSDLQEVRSGRELNVQSNLIKTKLSSLADTVSDEVGKSILLGSGTFNTYNKIINSAFYPDSDLIEHPKVGELLRDAALILASQESHEYESYEDIRKMPTESLSQLVFKGFSEDEPMLSDILRVLNGIVKLAYAIQLYEEMEESILSQLDHYVGEEYYGYKFINYYPQERIGDTVLVFRRVKDMSYRPSADELARTIIDLDWLDPEYEHVDPDSFIEELEKLLNSKIG